VTEVLTLLVGALLGWPVLGALLSHSITSDPYRSAMARVTASLTAITGIVVSLLIVFAHHATTFGPLVFDDATAVFLTVTVTVGVGSAFASTVYLREHKTSFFPLRVAQAWYYFGFFCFWTALVAIPLAANLGIAWLLVEATTGTSVLLVAYSGAPRALEAAWKYLGLTTLGLSVALLGIVILLASTRGATLSSLDWTTLERGARALPRSITVVAFVLLIAGLAAKIGWAPVHNWLPDAHSESPPPVSALLSAALLPSVILVAWRVKIALGPATGGSMGRELFIGFGLVSLAVAVPFLWRSLVWKRLLAYSSLEHMGIIALGIGFGGPLAIAGVVLHVLGHGVGKSFGFYSSIPLLNAQPGAARHPPRGIGYAGKGLASSYGLSLGVLSGLPPSPLFFSEVLILAGGFAERDTLAAGAAVLLLALGFLGLAHALLEGLLSLRPGWRHGPGQLGQTSLVLLATATTLLVFLAVIALLLPGSPLVTAIWRWSL